MKETPTRRSCARSPSGRETKPGPRSWCWSAWVYEGGRTPFLELKFLNINPIVERRAPMNMPNVATDFKDEKRRVVYRVLAFRKVSQLEGMHAIAAYQRQKKTAPRPDTLVQVITVIGLHD